jgi:hypothetical protein
MKGTYRKHNYGKYTLGTHNMCVLVAFIESNYNDGKGLLSMKRLLTLTYK